MVLSTFVILGTVASMLLFLRTLQLKSRKRSMVRETTFNSSIILINVKTRADCCDDSTNSTDKTNSFHKYTNSTNSTTSSHQHHSRTTTQEQPKGLLAKVQEMIAPPIQVPNCAAPPPSTANTKASSVSSALNPLPRKIFVDFGANDGTSVELFLVGDLADKRNQALSSFNKNNYSLRAFAINDTGEPFRANEWELHVFEANPRYTTKLMEQQAMLTNGIHSGSVSNNVKMNTQALLSKLNVSSNTSAVKSYHLHGSTAITDHNVHEIVFILDNQNNGAEGSTTMTESKSAVGRKITINATDIVTFFRTTLRARMEDYIVVKVDIEGAEYGLLRRMIDQCLLPFIDRMGVEWHHHNPWVFGKHVGDKNGSRADIRVKYTEQYTRIIEALNSSATYDKQTGKTWMDKVTIWG